MSHPVDTDGGASKPIRSPRITIRPCSKEDLETVRGLIGQVDLSADGLEDQFGDAYVVAELSGRTIGCAGVEIHGGFGLLRSVAVVPGRRRSGVGRLLVNNRLDWLRSHGIAAVYLLTETAGEFFERLGFVTIERAEAPTEIQASHEYAVMCPESAGLMMLRLT